MFVLKLWSGRYTRISQDAYLHEAPEEEKGSDFTTSLWRKQILDYTGLILLSLIFGSVGFAVGRNHPSTQDLVSRPDDVVPQGSKIMARTKPR
jgi:hypothetical protein